MFRADLVVGEPDVIGRLAIRRQFRYRGLIGFRCFDESAIPVFFDQCIEPGIRFFMIRERRRTQRFRRKDGRALLREFAKFFHMLRTHQTGALHHQHPVAEVKLLSVARHTKYPFAVHRKILQRRDPAQMEFQAGDIFQVKRLIRGKE